MNGRNKKKKKCTSSWAMQNEESITVFSSRMKTLMKEHKQIKITEMKKKKHTHTPWIPETQLQDSHWKRENGCLVANSKQLLPGVKMRNKINWDTRNIKQRHDTTWIWNIYLILYSVTKRLNKLIPIKSHFNNLLKNFLVNLHDNIIRISMWQRWQSSWLPLTKVNTFSSLVGCNSFRSPKPTLTQLTINTLHHT